MNKKGMTLIELMVYIALASLLLAPVIMLMHNSSLKIARDAKSLDISLSGRDVLNIMYGDIRNTGFKIKTFQGFTVSTPNGNVQIDSVFVDSTVAYGGTALLYDRSSFRYFFNSNGPYDSLEIIKGILDTAGVWDNVRGPQRIRYYVDTSKSLVREVIAPVVARDRKTLAYNVEALKFEFLNRQMDTLQRSGLMGNNATVFNRKSAVRYIKATLALKDDKNLSPSVKNTQDTIAGYKLNPSGKTIREIHSVVIPIPNNGLFP